MMHLRVRIAAEKVAVLHEDRTTTVRRYLQAMPGQLEVTINFGPQQAADVGAIRVGPVLVDLAADSCATDIVVSFEAQNIQAGFGQVCCVREPVVSCAYDDRIVCFHESLSL
jgi:hypothetical protein